MRYPNERGFSLLETLACIAIMAGALLASFDLIDQSMRVFGASDSAARNTLTVAAETALRRDIHAAVMFPEVGSGSTDVLELTLEDGSRVSWRRDRGALVRVEERDGDTPVESRSPVRGVVGWRWKVVASTLIEIRLDVSTAAPLTGLRQTGLPDRRMRTERSVLRLSPRGSRGEGSW